MSPKICALVLKLVFMNFCYGFNDPSHFRQQGARVAYFDRRYFKDLSVFTARPDRKSSYLTTFNGTSLTTIGNNVTIVIHAYNLKFKTPLINFELRVCDIWKQAWAFDFMYKYSDIKDCPCPPGRYHVNGIELPPKNMPILFEKVDYIAKFLFVISKSKEKMLEFSMELKYVGPKKH